MGLFSRHKKKDEKSSMPPPPSSSSGGGGSQPQQQNSGSQAQGGAGLNDIKQQVTGGAQPQQPPQPPNPAGMGGGQPQPNPSQGMQPPSPGGQASPAQPAQQPPQSPAGAPQPQQASASGQSQAQSSSSSNMGSVADDSLFDLSDLDLDSSSSSSSPSKEGGSTHEGTSHNPESIVDTNEDSEGRSMEFIRGSHGHGHGKKAEEEVLYITTAQFKNILEIIENVKNRVKDSSDKHTRLLDIKSEEDIEYENLRKDFQYIEDKLYEVDNLLFEK